MAAGLGERLPAGYVAAALADGDVDEVVALVRDCEAHDTGGAMFERADLVADLSLVDRGLDAIVVREAVPDPAVEAPRADAEARVPAGSRSLAGPIVAWGMVIHQRSRWADVHPRHRGRGLGRWLIEWSIPRARDLGADRIGQTVQDGRDDAVSLFQACGAVPVRTSWILRRFHDPLVPLAIEPQAEGRGGVDLRDSTPADQDEALDVMELAFRQWPDRLPATRETWRALVIEREGFTNAQLQVAVSGERIVGAAVLIDDGTEIWVDKLGTHPQFQGLGIGRALLQRSFALAHDRGRPSTALSTDSNTGALAFYERLGMQVTRSFTHWAIPLDTSLPADAPQPPVSGPPAPG